MAKKEDSQKIEEAAVPDKAGVDENAPKYLTDNERLLMKRVFESGPEESLPTITEVIDRIYGNEFDLTKWSNENPTGVMLPNHDYLWVSDEAMPTELYRLGGGLYDVVNRTNHPHIPSHTFSASGAISIRSQLYLCYTRKEIKAEKDRVLKEQFAMRVNEAEKGIEKDLGGVRLERQEKVPHNTGRHGGDLFRDGDTSVV